jgi:hypothetical protein
MKLNSLRLAASTLIISRTKPVYEFGTAVYFISIGLLSSDFMKKADSLNGFLVAPLVTFECKNRRVYRNLTPEPDHFLNMISGFTRQRFDTGDKILQYALQVVPE